MPKSKFVNIFIENIEPGHKVLDLGAGSGEYSQMFAEKGAQVTAVDSKLPDFLDNSIISHKMSIEDFISEDDSQYDLVFMRNLIQFLDKQWVFESLFPWIEKHLNKDGIIGIATFYKDPVPPFDHSMRSLYTLDELSQHFLKWQEIFKEQREHDGPDLSGKTRHFFINDLIVKKI